MDTVTLTIDGRQIIVEKGKTVLQAAIEGGIPVPYYCYHPGLGIDGSCRVCVVKIEKMPKLQTSCSTICADGMVVQTRTDDVVAARAGVFEFLLINHPLDCPVCDKGGECPLQDFSYTFGPDQSRMEFPRRVFDGEGVKGDVDFGPTLMLNRQRCILCTRCVRFMRDIDSDAQINIIDRGYGSEIATFQEEGVHSLLSGNLMDVCPVGAITTRDYRFKSRPWDNPDAVDTICTRCAKGCSATAWIKAKPEWAKGSSLIRFTPRFNPDVNGYWMCDIGRFDYHWIEGDGRLRQPLERDGAGGIQRPVAWPEALSRLSERLAAAGRTNPDGVRFLLPPMPRMKLFLFRRLAEELIGSAGTGCSRPSRRLALEREASARHTTSRCLRSMPQRERGANVRARSWRGRQPQTAPDVSALRAAAEAGLVSASMCLTRSRRIDRRHHLDRRPARAGKLPLLVVQGVVTTDLARAADFVLPGASYVEKEASYTNEQGRLQGTSRAIPARATPGTTGRSWCN